MVTAQEMGKKGGQAKSEAKAAAARKNATKPRGKWVTAIAYEIGNVEQHNAFGVVVTKGSPPAGSKSHEWLEAKVCELGVGLRGRAVGELEFLQLLSTSKRF